MLAKLCLLNYTILFRRSVFSQRKDPLCILCLCWSVSVKIIDWLKGVVSTALWGLCNQSQCLPFFLILKVVLHVSNREIRFSFCLQLNKCSQISKVVSTRWLRKFNFFKLFQKCYWEKIALKITVYNNLPLAWQCCHLYHLQLYNSHFYRTGPLRHSSSEWKTKILTTLLVVLT